MTQYRVWIFNVWPGINIHYPVKDPLEGMNKLKELRVAATLDKDKAFTASGLSCSDDGQKWEEYYDESGQDIHEMIREMDDDHNWSEQLDRSD